LETGLIDELEPVAGNDAISWSRQLAAREGIFCGITSGATFAAAMAVARRASRGSRILAMLPDTGERYLSTPLFADVPEQMTSDELEISNSTPGHRFDGAIQLTMAPAKRDVATEDAAALDDLIDDAREPIVVFGLEWCEFTWSVQAFLRKAGLPYRAVSLDASSYRAGRLGDRLRWALRNKVSSASLPQVFVAGSHIGGATETLKAFEDGSLGEALNALGHTLSEEQTARAMEHLPKWVQPRRAAC
jgi:cysteine synthase A